ncbi:hypothetical protein AC578_1641 [Pseudocercospora eumusae]|uniref:Potassium transport protein n=1 Tax=Pseudocercospora eumusae TaxID=321146 RepID=A0A139HLY0_9PEZI|nr:hypothetical protein AC578_1641 [Pseudocercospora eumusae]
MAGTLDFLEPLKEVVLFFKNSLPDRSSFPTSWKRPRFHFNFITWHYLYMLGMTILGSIMLYPAGIMDYIDALFFAAGMATQSGLNPIDINTLDLYQQVVMMLLTCICTPIFINTVVVFIRLYWFEKRFEHIVKEVRAQKRTKTRSITSRSKSQMRDDQDEGGDPSKLEQGVRGMSITVDTSTARFMHPSGRGEDTEKQRQKFKETIGPAVGGESSSNTPGSSLGRTDVTSSSDDTISVPVNQEEEDEETPSTHFVGLNPRLKREITFADEVPASGRHSPELARVPAQRDVSKHIEFLERQQNNAKKAGAIYIPGPRDFDRGERPEEIEEDLAIQRLNTRPSLGGRRSTDDPRGIRESETAKGSPDDEHPRRGIIINLPDHPAHRDQAATVEKDDEEDPDDISRLDRIKSALSRRRSHRTLGEHEHRSFAKTFTNLTQKKEDEDPMPYLSWTATTGRNSMFVGLTSEQREELGGIEYRALKLLAKILIAYYVGFHLLGMLILLPWIVSTEPWKGIVQSGGTNPVWWGFFTPASLFNDLGFTLTPDSMISFDNAVLPLLFGSFLIIIGNTGFPCMLRFIIWSLSKVVRYGTDTWEELRFLLDHPRRCFTLLFPSKATWWLFWVLVLFNVVDLIFFIILDLNAEVVIDLSPGLRVLNGWFQATSTRTAGFASVNLAALHAAIQVSYMIMMYISVFPIAISVRRTNVYEEKSLGIFGGEEDPGDDSDQSYVSQHLRRQLSFDLWYIFLGLFIIAIVEGDRIANTNQYAFTTFSVLFEIVSAYGTVGLSLGYPDSNTSFSAEFRTISKLVIIAMMIRGRHRGLPYALDRAILLPSEKLHKKEAEEGDVLSRRLTRRGSAFAEDSRRDGAWENDELDKYGLPAQHTGSSHARSKTDIAMTAGAGGDAEPQGLLQRRSTAVSSTNSREGTTAQVGLPVSSAARHKRGRSLSRLIVGGLASGPTFSKHHH